MKLFNCFAESGYHTSIITTFGIDFDAYEAIALPRLRDAGCNNNIVVADGPRRVFRPTRPSSCCLTSEESR